MVESIEDLRRMISEIMDRQRSVGSRERVFELFKQQMAKRDMVPTKEETDSIIEWCVSMVDQLERSTIEQSFDHP